MDEWCNISVVPNFKWRNKTFFDKPVRVSDFVQMLHFCTHTQTETQISLRNTHKTRASVWSFRITGQYYTCYRFTHTHTDNTHIYTHGHVNRQTHTDRAILYLLQIHTYTRGHIHTHIHTHTHGHTHTHEQTDTHRQGNIILVTDSHIHTWTHTYTHMDTHTHTHIHRQQT